MSAPKSTPALDAAIAEAEALGMRVESVDDEAEHTNTLTASIFVDGAWTPYVTHWISIEAVTPASLAHRAGYLRGALVVWREIAAALAAHQARRAEDARTAWRPAEVSR